MRLGRRLRRSRRFHSPWSVPEGDQNGPCRRLAPRAVHRYRDCGRRGRMTLSRAEPTSQCVQALPRHTAQSSVPWCSAPRPVAGPARRRSILPVAVQTSPFRLRTLARHRLHHVSGPSGRSWRIRRPQATRSLAAAPIAPPWRSPIPRSREVPQGRFPLLPMNRERSGWERSPHQMTAAAGSGRAHSRPLANPIREGSEHGRHRAPGPRRQLLQPSWPR